MLFKIILTILAAIGAIVVVGIVAIIVAYLFVARRISRRVRQSFEEFEAMSRGSIDAGYIRESDVAGYLDYEVPPMRIHLQRASLTIWANEPGVGEAAKWIMENGFEFIGDFVIGELRSSRLKVFLSEDGVLVATIRQDDAVTPAYVEFCFDLGSNRRGGVSNPPHATVPLPDDAVGEHFFEDFYDGVHILPKMLQRARELAEDNRTIRVDRERIAEFFEAAHAAEMDFRIQRGGLTTEEIQLALYRDRQLVSPTEIEEIQWNWQDAIEHFLVEQSPKGADYLGENGLVIAVHDSSLSSFLYRRISKFYETSGIDPTELNQIAHELETLLRIFKPREAIARFRPLLPRSIRFSLIDQLRKPVDADLYLLPQWE